MGFLQVLLLSYRHLRGAQAVASSLSSSSTHHVTPNPSSALLHLTLSSDAIGFPSSFTRITRTSANATGRHQASPRCLAVPYLSWHWERKRRRARKKRESASCSGSRDETRVKFRGSAGEEAASLAETKRVARCPTQREHKLTPSQVLNAETSGPSFRLRVLSSWNPCCFGRMLRSESCTGSASCGGVSTTWNSGRECHTHTSDISTGRSLTGPSSHAAPPAEKTGGAPSLLEGILRRLEGRSSSFSSAGHTDTVESHQPSMASSFASTSSASRQDVRITGCSVEGRCSEGTPAYVPLLFRPDFLQSLASRRRQLHTSSSSNTLLEHPQESSAAATAASSLPSSLPSAADAAVEAKQLQRDPLWHSPCTCVSDAKTIPDDREERQGSHAPSAVNHVSAVEPAREGAAETIVTTGEEVPPTTSSASTLASVEFQSAATPTDHEEGLAEPLTGPAAVTHYMNQEKQEALHDLADDDAAVAGSGDHWCIVNAVSASAAPATATPSPTSSQRRARQLILDPIEWLAQAADAPLMDTAALHAHTTVKDQLEEAVATATAETDAGRAAVYMPEEVAEGKEGNREMTEEQTRDSEEQEAALLADLLVDVPRQQRRGRKQKQKQAESTDATDEAATTTRAHHARPSEPPTGQQDTNGVATTAAASVEPDALVYNVFTRRVSKASAPSIRMLALLGIHAHPETRELAVMDPEALHSLATELRARRVSWPQLWSRGPLYRQLERLLSDETVTDAAARVAALLRLQYDKSHLRQQRPGLVAGDGSPPSTGVSSEFGSASDTAAAAAAAAAPMAESVDDKLLTLQDLNEEQQAVVELVLKGHHTYIGGGAGTGKSVLLRVLKQQLVRQGLAVAMTGTTGVAGTQIGGCTLHHCLGVNVNGEFTRRKDLCSYDVIIIDEVSMLSRELFESLELHLRRANNAHLPFGGIQLILCGDFLQLGAIGAQPLITSPIFRRHFVQLRLRTVVRHNTNTRFAAQLQQLRRGRVPADLGDTVHFVTTQQAEAAHAALEVELRARQQAQLAALAPAAQAFGHGDGEVGERGAARSASSEAQRSLHDGAAAHASTTDHTSPPPPQPPVTSFVRGAVNLLPTNREVELTNAQQLQQLPGELISYVPQFLPPCLVGSWSPTFILRVHEPAKLQVKLLRLEILRYLGNFYTLGQRASSPLPPSTTASVLNFSDGAWLLDPQHVERNVVLYALFTDALALRVRLPLTMDREEARQFLLYVAELDRHLETLHLGVRVRDVLTHGDGLHTEQDEYILSQYAARAPLAHSLELKVGARVMLRTNLGPNLVNGSLGTVVGFRKLIMEELPRYVVGNAQREEAIVQYSDFLQYEQGFHVPVVPVVDFSGRQVPIPPMIQYVGGLPNTHFYSLGVVALPLSLAYAFTVHKVQGLTLVGRVHLELSRMWPCEHLLYVAMSRVRNPEQLSVSSFHPKLVRTAADCLLFDDSLPPVWEARIAPYMLAATWRRSPSRRKKVLLKKQLEDYVKQRRNKLKQEARKGDIQAEIRLLEEKMLRQRAKAAAKAKETS